MIWTALGWLGAGCFFARILVQWLASERAQRSVSPPSFWWLSLAGSLAMGCAALAEEALVLLPGYLVTASIYARNLVLQRRAQSSRLGPIPAALLGLGAALVLIVIVVRGGSPEGAVQASPSILAVGVIGQVVWSVRFLVQWYFTERRGYSHFPSSFWWITLVGSAFNLIYTGNLVASQGSAHLAFFASYLPTPIFPIRNLMLERRRRLIERAAEGTNLPIGPH